MNKYLKEFLKRGLMFGGFGPIVLGVIYFLVNLQPRGLRIIKYFWRKPK